MRKLRKIGRWMRSNMAVGLIGTFAISLTIFGIFVSIIGNYCFTQTVRNIHAETTYHIGSTARSLVNADHIDAYLNGEEMDEYWKTKEKMDSFCKRIGVSLIYVLKVDTSDYGRFVSVLDSIDNSVDNSTYTEWGIGYEREASNEEYSQKYKAIYEDGSEYETIYRLKGTKDYHPHITTMLPIAASDGDVVAILCVQRPINEIVEFAVPYMITVGVAIAGMVLLLGLIVSSFVEKRFIKPIQRVSEEATRFAKENTKGEPLGKISRYTELTNLAGSIDKMESDMVEYVENLTAATAERERIGTELTFAKSIQAESLPSVFPPFPDRTDFSIYASMTPAKAVGGDFYNFYLIDDDHLGIVIGDVSGKGVPAALFMMVCNIVISDRIRMGGTPAEILTFANDNICERNKMMMFVTLWLGIIELSTGKVIAANAGHEDAAVYRKGGAFELFKTRHGIPVGAMEGVRYRDFEMQLNPGDKIFIYTDGVPEATDKDDEMYGLDRMIEALNACRDADPQGILEGVHRDVNEFVGDAPQFDDLTMLCVAYKDSPIDK